MLIMQDKSDNFARHQMMVDAARVKFWKMVSPAGFNSFRWFIEAKSVASGVLRKEYASF